MKTQSTNSLQIVSKTAFLFILLVLVACKQKDESSAASKDGAKAPEVDIHTAIVKDDIKALQQHIEAGTDLNEKDPFGGSSPLITAALFGKTEAAKMLIDAGADLNFKNKDGSTPLHTAAFFCRPEIVKMLLDKGVDKTIRNNFNATAYESVATPFKDAKGIYEMMGKALAPMGLKLDYAYIEKTRPEIAAMLK
ncbi:ankyrin repeat domain-containing protein [Cytophagaceae bacterium YF14B1]|uniref:Ankyrin repeat domain-containing protein n=1 Tax=Xanthocytophaga flava TaxID=3048013 RepID=A0AAE3QSN7_9BACT|nr:ankyrin repeat domain-containing protein [Xanthocytophaga flavus]MDJ1482516.1 ankyrin repeat domain-containing protein [Xanthocytophaga flavus]